jgi:hypothetical protein
MNQSHPKRIHEQARRLEALQLRKSGKTYKQIGDSLGIDRGNAWKLVDFELKKLRTEVRETAKDVLDIEVSRLEEIIEACWEKMKGGSVPHAQTILRVMERKAKMMGLDAPLKVEGKMSFRTDAELLADAERLGVPITPELKKELSGEPSPQPEEGVRE